MATDVVIPKMGMTMESGTLVEWLVADGATVEVGQPLFHMVTEKLDCDVEAEGAGVLVHLVAPDTTLEPGGLVGRLLAPGEAPAAVPPTPEAGDDGDHAGEDTDGAGRVVASPNARRLARALGVSLASVGGSGPGGRIVGADVEAAAAAPRERGSAERRIVSPIARKLAESLDVDLANVTGSGPGGRITRQDVEQAAAGSAPGTGSVAAGAARRDVDRDAGTATVARDEPAVQVEPVERDEPAEREEPAGRDGAGEVIERIRLIGMRGTIASRMHASLQEMAQLTLLSDVDVTRAVKLRRRLAKDWEAEGRRAPSYTDLVIKAVAASLVEHPALNARIADGHVERLGTVHIGLAVSLDDGLVVPVLRHTDRMALREVSDAARELADQARDGRLGLDDLHGSTFSVTALGAFGIDGFTPVVNPPNAAILGVGRVRDVAVPTSRRRVRRRRQLTLSLTFDHRAVDGVPAARFLAAVTARLEAPLRLLT